MDVSLNGGVSPQFIHFNMVFHSKPSILGYHHFRKPPYTAMVGSFPVAGMLFLEVLHINPSKQKAPPLPRALAFTVLARVKDVMLAMLN